MMKTTPKLCLAAFLVFGVLVGAAHAQDLRSAAGKNFRFWDPDHGSQIEYIGPRGLWAFLWYPGNRVIVPRAGG